MKKDSRLLREKKIAVLMADGFEMAEYTIPVNALRAAGAHATVISLRHGRIRGVNLHEPAHKVHVDLTVEEADPRDYDALFIPGGFINPDLLRQSAAARTFVQRFAQTGRPVASLCHGPWLLASSGLLPGRTITSWPGIRDDLVFAGATWVDQPVVRDGNWLTSRGPQDFAQFIPALTRFFAEAEDAEAFAAPREHVESSPQRDRPPAIVLSTMKWMPRPSFRGFGLAVALGALALFGLRNGA